MSHQHIFFKLVGKSTWKSFPKPISDEILLFRGYGPKCYVSGTPNEGEHSFQEENGEMFVYRKNPYLKNARCGFALAVKWVGLFTSSGTFSDDAKYWQNIYGSWWTKNPYTALNIAYSKPGEECVILAKTFKNTDKFLEDIQKRRPSDISGEYFYHASVFGATPFSAEEFKFVLDQEQNNPLFQQYKPKVQT